MPCTTDWHCEVQHAVRREGALGTCMIIHFQLQLIVLYISTLAATVCWSAVACEDSDSA